jgi:hypothetical protein
LQVTFGFVEEVEGRGLITTTVKERESYVQPQGLMHFDFNDNCEPAQFDAFFAALDFGTAFSAPNILLMPDGVLLPSYRSPRHLAPAPADPSRQVYVYQRKEIGVLDLEDAADGVLPVLPRDVDWLRSRSP